jgi:soluble lytic murein transglycosylase
MRAGKWYSQNGDDTRGGVQRRIARYEQGDPRGQYPHPRDNQFAQPRPRIPAQPQAVPAQAAPPEAPLPQPQREPEPRRAVYRDGDAQYEQPRTPYVPGYMRTANRQNVPQEPDTPVRQADYLRQQNPYTLMSEKSGESRTGVKQRTLIVLTFIAAFVLAGVWITQLLFAAQTQAVLAARAAAEEAVADKHPFPSAYRELIETEAVKNNLSPAFVAAIILNESSFNPDAESSVGARGLMQMMEDTAAWVYDQIGYGAAYSFDQMYNAETNVEYGCWYLAYLSDKFGGDPILIAAAFHSGQTNVFNWLNNAAYSSDQKTITLDKMPDGNTKAYVERVLNSFAAYRRIYYEEVTA